MADLKGPESNQASTEAPVKETSGTRKKASTRRKAARQQNRALRTRSPKTARQTASVKSPQSSATPTARRGYSEKERAQKLSEIEKLTGQGTTVREAIKRAGISEQTYYHWKRAAGQTEPASGLGDLVKLEEENARLKTLLAEQLRKENAELKKKLGLT